jgi:DNA/RNA-binding domain of Phe-tRNA-synthetase-like protein
MIFRIDAEVFQQFPTVRIGIVSALDLNNRGDDAEITDLLRRAETDLIDSMQGVQVTEHPRIKPWREAYRKFGAKPKNYHSSIESLVRRVMKGAGIRHINKLVDIYNAVSLRHLLPAGGEDLDSSRGEIRLTSAGDDEAPVRLLGESEERSPHPGEIIYKDDLGAICRRWNWKEADRTKLTENTQNAVLVIESLPPATVRELEDALEELAGLTARFCGGTVRREILDRRKLEFTLRDR